MNAYYFSEILGAPNFFSSKFQKSWDILMPPKEELEKYGSKFQERFYFILFFTMFGGNFTHKKLIENSHTKNNPQPQPNPPTTP